MATNLNTLGYVRLDTITEGQRPDVVVQVAALATTTPICIMIIGGIIGVGTMILFILAMVLAGILTIQGFSPIHIQLAP